MTVDERVVQRLKELIQMGEQVLATKREPPGNTIGFDATVNSQDAYQWFTSVQNILVRVFSSESEHYKNFTARGGKRGLTYSPVFRAQGILKAALDDFEGGHLFHVRELVEAELFADFLEQARQLLDAGYFAPAAVVAGSVLEDGLRKLCGKHELAVPERPKIDQMNADLAKAGVYTKLVQKRVTAIAGVRNSAAHGHWDEFEEADVEDMVSWTGRFMEDHFA